MDTVIGIENLGLTFNDNGTRLQAANVLIHRGDFVIVTGDNGSGKSSLFHLLMMQGGTPYYTPDQGAKIVINFVPALAVHNLLELNKNQRELLRASIAFVEQEDYFSYGVRAYEHLLNYAEIYIGGYAEDKKNALIRLKTLAERYVRDYLGFTGLKEMKKRRIFAYSAGQRKVINVLSAFLKCEACGTNIIFLDEPLNNLDVHNKKLLRDIISDIRAKNPDLTILMISHCRIFPAVNKELKIGKGTITVIDAPVSYDCLGASVKQSICC